MWITKRQVRLIVIALYYAREYEMSFADCQLVDWDGHGERCVPKSLRVPYDRAIENARKFDELRDTLIRAISRCDS